MGRTLFLLLSFLISTSCSLMKGPASIEGRSIQDLLNSVKAEGEGRGRLKAQGQENVFSYEAVLKENTDWLLAVSIPLHGEEVMLLPRLKEKKVAQDDHAAFEERLLSALHQELRGDEALAREYMFSIRNMLRFLNAKKLDLSPVCREEKEFYRCRLDDQEFQVQTTQDRSSGPGLSIESDARMVVKARNLTDSFFSQTVFDLRQGEKQILQLELFWK